MMKGKNMTQNYYMFNGGKIVSDKPLLTEYPKISFIIFLQ